MADSEWTVCPHCGLKHRLRPDGNCPRCQQSLAGGDFGEGAPPMHGAAYGGAGTAGLSEVYDGRALPGSQLEQSVAETNDDFADSPWFMLLGGLVLVGAAFYLHGVFGGLESGERESVRVWWGIAVLYNTLGPAITVAVVGIVGAVVTWSGLRRLV